MAVIIDWNNKVILQCSNGVMPGLPKMMLLWPLYVEVWLCIKMNFQIILDIQANIKVLPK